MNSVSSSYNSGLSTKQNCSKQTGSRVGEGASRTAVTTENAKPSARQARIRVRLVTHAQTAKVLRTEWVAPASHSKVGRCSSAEFSRGEVSGTIVFLLLFCLTQTGSSSGL